MDQNQNPFAPYDNTPTPAEQKTEATNATPPVQPTYYDQPTGGSPYFPPITPNERQNNAVPNYVPNVAPSVNAEEPLSVGEWMLTMLVMMIPCVNIIMMFVWAFGSGNKSRSNYFKASLIWAAIGIGLSVLIAIACALLGVSLASSMYDMYGF